MKLTFLAIGLSLMAVIAVAGTASAAGKTLYERLGGEAAHAAVVDQFVAYNNADAKIAPRWQASDMDELKEYLTELLCEATGGPCAYTGKAMDVAHSGLNVTREEFARVAQNLVRGLDKFKVPAQEKGELLAIVGSLQGQVVGK